MIDAAGILHYPLDSAPSPGEFIRAAMHWHFSPETGSRFWLERAQRLDFDPLADVKSFEDLRLFPDFSGDLRSVPIEDLIPRGYGPEPDVTGVYESGGTTGAAKRIIFTRDWLDREVAIGKAAFQRHGVTPGGNWLALLPTGPHMIGGLTEHEAAEMGGHKFSIDMDPRWVKKLIAAGDVAGAAAYADHLVDQAAHVLQTQDIRTLLASPPMLDRIAGRPALVELIRAKVSTILWGGTHMSAENRHFHRTELFPGKVIVGSYGSTTFLGSAKERPGLGATDPCVFDSGTHHLTFSVLDPRTGEKVAYGERGQVLVNHIGKAMFLPNNLERDTALRIEAPPGQVGDSVADVEPLDSFDDEDVIEGVY
ncbi:phenazine antibiotic biosynthesis protein [Amycolatopsis japonica]|uniref:phenazine antibiotic biosynthesis protein n=1 Tax=Amycolatopsis japonica TaxID=208439 RepID=UPI0036711160